MTTTDTPDRPVANESGALSSGILRVFRRSVFMNGIDDILPETGKEPEWFEPVIKAMAKLPWDEDNWNDDAKPTQPSAAARLLVLLAEILDDATPPPYIVPTWRGGIQAEWHQNGIDLEIEVDPEGWLEYYFENDSEHYEGPLTEENLSELIRQARGLLTDAARPSESDDHAIR